MQNQNRIFDDMAKMAGGALSALTAFKQEMETMIRDRFDRFMSEANYVRREEFEAVKAMASAARAEQEKLAARVAALEGATAAKPRKASPRAKSKSAAKS
ncbi:MAG: accessory factor UbiK family protein [Rhodobacteraceae bacterium]|nr:accessory factor UbiK family protein [Paracoccaceae bacterium]